MWSRLTGGILLTVGFVLPNRTLSVCGGPENVSVGFVLPKYRQPPVRNNSLDRVTFGRPRARLDTLMSLHAGVVRLGQPTRSAVGYFVRRAFFLGGTRAFGSWTQSTCIFSILISSTCDLRSDMSARFDVLERHLQLPEAA